MKKIISIMLVLVLAFSCLSLTAFADTNNKINDRLVSLFEEIEDDFKVQVFVSIYDVVDEDLVVQKTFEECGLTKQTAKTQEEVDLYQRTYRRIKAEMYEQHNNVVLEKMNIPDEDVMFLSKLTPYFILKATKAKVYEIAALDEVYDISLYKMPLFPQPDHLFEARFLEQYENSVLTETHDYDELYYHYDENGEIDWALIEQCSYNAPPWEYHEIVRGRWFTYGDHYPFSFRYGIYDVKEDKFYDIINESFDYSKYEDLEEVFESFNFGYLIGDADKDGVLSVMDATCIQRFVAQLTDIDDIIPGVYYIVESEECPGYMSDFNLDGRRDVLDATAIQRNLAHL